MARSISDGGPSLDTGRKGRPAFIGLILKPVAALPTINTFSGDTLPADAQSRRQDGYSVGSSRKIQGIPEKREDSTNCDSDDAEESNLRSSTRSMWLAHMDKLEGAV